MATGDTSVLPKLIMAKLVLLSAGMTGGRTHDLKVDKTTIGRLEDNLPNRRTIRFQPSLRDFAAGSDVVVRRPEFDQRHFLSMAKRSPKPFSSQARFFV